MNTFEPPPIFEPSTISLSGPVAQEMSRLQVAQHRITSFFWRLRNRLPYLVWRGDEVDVHVTFKDIGALGGDPRCIFEVQQLLNRMGVSFDTGSGCDGRDWEWDFSLSGPISVTFRSRAMKPERRVAPPKLRAVA